LLLRKESFNTRMSMGAVLAWQHFFDSTAGLMSARWQAGRKAGNLT
jgi:hypothetical protein